ncbi:MAG: hypothetical protein QNJ63_25790 [Calothrix sp. MO_192.B10]|nr:hypothetical protein [Calothrix sp. MO_192.B10]
MLEYSSISKDKPEFPNYLNFQTLRDIGISHLQALSGKIWTDYNLHDPGVTILEVLCYAVTDLGYRNNLDLEDLLALNPADSQQQENNFFTPDQILTCNPVTEMDLRKRLMDIPGVRNACLEKFTEVEVKEKTEETTEELTKKLSTYHPAIYVDYANSKLLHNPPDGYTEENAPRLHPRGLYTVYIDLDREYGKNACGQIYSSWSNTLDQVKAVLCRYRNLCEDVYDIVVLGEEEIGLCSDIELEAEADAEDVLVEIYVKIQEFLSPRLQFYTLQELLDKGKSIDEIFAGRPSVIDSRKIQRQLVTHESKEKQNSRVYYKYKLISQHKSPLLEGAIGYENRTEAIEGFDKLLDLSRNLSNYRLIDNAEGDNPYSFAVHDENEEIASHPQLYATAIQRNKALYSVIDAVKADDNYDSHGFIDTAELEALTPPEVIYTSDLYQEILKISGVVAVRRLSIVNFINGLAQSQSPWNLQLTKGYSPVLGIERSKINLFKGTLPISPDRNEVKRRYYEQQAAHIKVLRQDSELDLSVPQGSYYDLADHYSIQHDFPLTYGISEYGLPATASVLRKAQARQLKGYLVFFDQLLANYLAQLAHVRDLFSWEFDTGEGRNNDHMSRPEDKSHTYFIQELDFPDKTSILGEGGDYLDSILEEPETYRDRRNRFLDHLLGRFAESFADYVLINYRTIQQRQYKVKDEVEVIHDKARFLQDYPVLSRDRFRAFNYCNYEQVWDTANVAGFQKRVSRLLSFEDVRRRDLCHYEVDQETSRLIFSVSCGVENESLTSLQTYPSQQAAQADIEKFLLLALHENFYKGFTYSYFYHYGLQVEVVDQGETIIARYQSYFFSQAERFAGLDFLTENLPSLFNLTEQDTAGESVVTPAATSTISQENIIAIKRIEEENLYYFQLNIPVNSSQTSEAIKFEGVGRYFSEAAAREAAIAILKQIANRQNYHPILFRQDNSAERETATPSNETRFIHYGYALIDNEGKVLAQSCDRLPTPEAREIYLQRWFSNIQLNHNQFQFTVEKIERDYIFTVKHNISNQNTDNQNTENQILLRSCQSHPEEILAWQSAAKFAENLRYLKRYVSPVKDKDGNNYALGIVDHSGNLLATATTQTNAFATFKQLNSLETPDSPQSFLQIDEEVTAQTSSYRFQLVDREGVTLLESIQLFEDENTARDRFYQDVLGVLFEPGAIEPTTTNEGFGFRVLSKPRNRRSAVATSSRFYPSEKERDGAIEHLFLLIRTARLNITWTGLENSSEDPTYIGRVYDQNRNILLESSQHYTTSETAWEQGDVLMELAGAEVEFPKNGKPDAKNFRLINVELTLLPFWYKWSRHIQKTQPVDVVTLTLWVLSLTYYLIIEKPYGWELTNWGKDQILATHYYTSKEERNQSIQTLQQLVNDEGFHLLEHILLRPRIYSPPDLTFWLKWFRYISQKSNLTLFLWFLSIAYYRFQTVDNFLPICVNTDDATRGEQTQLTYQDPYSFWITIILPYWPERFRNIDFRRFVSRTLRLEAPAHVVLKIAWVNVRQMRDFEVAYRHWLEQLALDAGYGSACNLSETLNRLLTIIPQLRSIYPQGILYDPQVVSQDQPIILNQTALGTAND